MGIKATIIIPVYNGEATIRRAVDSALHQDTKESYEILLIDDGSKDKSGEILDSYEKGHDRVFVIHQKNQGITRTRENGIKAARGEFIYWIDADDYASPALLSKTLPLLEEGKDIVVFGTHYFYENGEPDREAVRDSSKTADDWRKDTLNASLSTLWTFATRRDYWVGEKSPSQVARSAADGYMTIRLFDKAKKIVAIPDVLYFQLKDSPFSISHTFTGKRYLGNAFLWHYRLQISEKSYHENINHCSARAFSGYVKAFCMDTIKHDLTEEDKRNIKDALRKLKKYPISGRLRDKFLCWAILNDHIWFCRKYAVKKNKKTETMNLKMESDKK